VGIEYEEANNPELLEECVVDMDWQDNSDQYAKETSTHEWWFMVWNGSSRRN
jgi:hypothetical protein